MKFDTSDKQWNPALYQSIAEKIGSAVLTESIHAGYAL